MGGELLVIRTDAPAEVLSELEKISCEIFINGANYEDVPIWADVLKENDIKTSVRSRTRMCV